MTAHEPHPPRDHYTDDDGEVILTGVQALARLPIAQLRVDRAGGYNTAAFVSGYQRATGKEFVRELALAVEHVPDLPILVRPAVNEELAATAVMGSQLVSNQVDAKYEGVVGFWYGEASGLDRASDAIRNANFTGASRFGGAVALVGDGRAATGSATPSSSDLTLIDLNTPVFQPGDVQELLDLGRHAVALSRLTGLWTAMKVVTAVGNGSGTATLALDRVKPIEPILEVDGLLHVPIVDGSLAAVRTMKRENEIDSVCLEIARRYGVVNDLNRPTANPRRGWIGIVAGGYTYHEVVEALRRMGLESLNEVEAAGIRLLRLQMPFPLDRRVVRNFARGLEEVVVVEERARSLEWMVKDALYGGDVQPRIVGRVDERGHNLIPGTGFLVADDLIPALHRRLSARVGDRLLPLEKQQHGPVPVLAVEQAPADAADQVSGGNTAMGGEGSQWIGMAPFVERHHFLQRLDAFTLYHSGQLAIHGAVAAGSNITYELAYDRTVAMVGDGAPAGFLEIKELVKVLLAEGVTEVVVITDDPDRRLASDLPTSRHAGRTKVWGRNRIAEARDHLATVPRVSVLIDDEQSAAEPGRKKQPGRPHGQPARVLVDRRIFEPCADCPRLGHGRPPPDAATAFGATPEPDRDVANRDLPCREGQCRSFLLVHPAAGRDDDDDRTETSDPSVIAAGLEPLVEAVGEPVLAIPVGGDRTEGSPDRVDLRVAGTGGTDTTAAARILATAAMLDGWTVRGLDRTGPSPTARSRAELPTELPNEFPNEWPAEFPAEFTVSDLRLTRGEPSPSNLIGTGQADVILGFDLPAAASDLVVTAGRRGTTVVVASTTGHRGREPAGDPQPTNECELRAGLAAYTDARRNRFVDAGDITGRVFGSDGGANMFLIGVAHQSGLMPMASEAIERAIELNGNGVEVNRSAFRLGRCWAHGADARGPAELNRLWFEEPDDQGDGSDSIAGETRIPEWLSKQLLDLRVEPELRRLLTRLTADLVAYQNPSYAQRFVDFMTRSVGAERLVAGDSVRLSTAVAKGLHNLMAYRDEYEIARLLLGPEARAAAEKVGGRGATITWKLHPPLLRALGMSRRMSLGPGRGRLLLSVLAAGKRLRGTALDPLGRRELRRTERALIDEYQSAMSEALHRLNGASFEATVELAASAMEVRGFEQLKLERLAELRRRLSRGAAVPAH